MSNEPATPPPDDDPTDHQPEPVPPPPFKPNPDLIGYLERDQKGAQDPR
jgi:hypothetical protein